MSTTATPKQTQFIRDLLAQKELTKSPQFFDATNAMDANELAQYMQYLYDRAATVTRDRASAWIESLLALPNKPRHGKTNERDEPAAGMYRNGEYIYRVYLGQKSGRMLVKELVNSGDEYRYEYLGAAAHKLPADAQPLPLDEAKAFGRMTGTCCVCARRLDNPESVDAGIGPVCASKFDK